MVEITPQIQQIIDFALVEDQVFNDPTTKALISSNDCGVGVLRAKSSGLLAGIDVALTVFRRIDGSIDALPLINDGDRVERGSKLAQMSGKVATILRGERTALNFLQRMSGIATETARYVKAVEGCHAQIVDTRKTVPGHRYLDKYAVTVGGGRNHRMHLGDGVLIKDNHIDILQRRGMDLLKVLEQAMERAPHTLKIEVEVRNLDELRKALIGGAQIIMLDNMTLEEMKKAVEAVNGCALVEASGGISLDNVRAVAETGVDLISVGALTHSVPALDISLDLEA